MAKLKADLAMTRSICTINRQWAKRCEKPHARIALILCRLADAGLVKERELLTLMESVGHTVIRGEQQLKPLEN
jgi:hypothetical protein